MQSPHDVERTYAMSSTSTAPKDQFVASVAENTPTTLSAQSSMAALRVEDPQEGANVQELPPVDRGVGAWTFCAAAFVLEMMIWGFSFRSAWTFHPIVLTRLPNDLHDSYGIFQGTYQFNHATCMTAHHKYRLLHFTSPIQRFFWCRDRCSWHRIVGLPIRRGQFRGMVPVV